MTEKSAAPSCAPVRAFRVDPEDHTPPYLQLRTRVIEAIRSGQLVPGQQLPTVRALADSAGLAVNTVAHAYRSLDEDGFVEGRGRAGTFVTMTASGDEQARRAALDFAERISRLDLEESQIIEYVRDALRALGRDRESDPLA